MANERPRLTNRRVHRVSDEMLVAVRLSAHGEGAPGFLLRRASDACLGSPR